MLDHRTIAYKAQHELFPELAITRPTRGACEKYIAHRFDPGAWRLFRILENSAGRIVEREMQQGSHWI